jgi:protein phosphatase
MTLLLASAARATVGGRSGQEDAFRLWPAEGAVPPKSESGGLLAVLADGMGGHTGGAIAGQTACKTFTEAFSATSAPLEARLKSALNASNEALAKGVEQNAALKGMGCTIVAAWMDDLGIRWTSVGDSLLLLYRLPDVIRLNADHSLGSFLDEQARQNKISRSEARRNRNRNALRSALTGSKIDLIDLRSEPLELRPGDWVVLASDGLGSLSGDEIADVIYRFRQSTPEEMADGLIAAVTQKGAVDQDNATVVVVRVDGAPEASDDVATRVLARPSKGEEVDLRTRRIGVSRRGPGGRRSSAGAKTRAAAVWLAAAVALAFCAVVLMLAVPSLRPTMPSNPEAPVPTTAPANAAVDRPTGPVAPAKPSAKTPGVEPTPQITPPSTSPGRPAGESEEGSAPRASQSKSAATPPATSPPTSSSSESEEGATPRSAPSKPAASQPAPPAASSPAPPTEEEATAPKPAKPRTGTAKLPGSSAATPTRKSGITGEGSPPRQSKEVERSRPKSSPGIFGEEQGTETLPIMPR